MAMKMMQLSQEKKDQFEIWNSVQAYLGIFFIIERQINRTDVCWHFLYHDFFEPAQNN